MRTFHVPMPDELHAALRAEAKSACRPATELVREALGVWLETRRRQRIADEIRAYAQLEAGGEGDLEPNLEEAGIQHLLAADGP